jgi:hypothetical protein
MKVMGRSPSLPRISRSDVRFVSQGIGQSHWWHLIRFVTCTVFCGTPMPEGRLALRQLAGEPLDGGAH